MSHSIAAIGVDDVSKKTKLESLFAGQDLNHEDNEEHGGRRHKKQRVDSDRERAANGA
jgi:hypothetical protein